jgi:hypothetical protein
VLLETLGRGDFEGWDRHLRRRQAEEALIAIRSGQPTRARELAGRHYLRHRP